MPLLEICLYVNKSTAVCVRRVLPTGVGDTSAPPGGAVGPRRPPALPERSALCVVCPAAAAMEPGSGSGERVAPWGVCEETAILHGGFLLASRLLQPRPLRELPKAEWPLVGPPITDALREIGARCPSPRQHGLWKKEAVALVWAKVLLPAPPAASLDREWKEDAFFSVGAMIPDVNRTVLFELVKALGAARLFAQLLLALPPGVCRAELRHLVRYVGHETAPSDVGFLLDVWWEVVRHVRDPEDSTVTAFSSLVREHGCECALDDGLQPPKRFKGDPSSLNGSPAADGLLVVLMEGLKQTYGSIASPRMRCYALGNLVELLSVFTELEPQGGPLPVAEYLAKVSSVVSLWSSDTESQHHHSGLDEKVKEAERTMSFASIAKLSREELI